MSDSKRIRHLRSLILVHSYLYYVLDNPIVDDIQWQLWADELAEINKPISWYDEMFEGWDGTTGYHLKYDPWVIGTAIYLVRLHGNR
jgi:hypothetical protein